VRLIFNGNAWHNWNVFSKNFGEYEFDSLKQVHEIIENHVAWYGEKSRREFVVCE
jgi:hypothetical protein